MALPLKKALHPSTNFEIKEYYENESRFNGVDSRDNSHETTKNAAYIVHWIALSVKNNERL